jgi:hypothetical protein
MRFTLGLLLGYSIRGNRRLLIAILTATAFVAFVCFIVLPAIALSLLALDVKRERLSRPPQTTVPVVVGLDYKTAEMKLHMRISTCVFWRSDIILRLNLDKLSIRRPEAASV